MIIYLNQHRAAPHRVVKNGAYSDEIMNASWNPVVEYLFNDVPQCAASPELPDDSSDFDADAFLSRVYALATQI